MLMGETNEDIRGGEGVRQKNEAREEENSSSPGPCLA